VLDGVYLERIDLTIWPMFGIANQLLAGGRVVRRYYSHHQHWQSALLLGDDAPLSLSRRPAGRRYESIRDISAAGAEPRVGHAGLHQYFTDSADHDGRGDVLIDSVRKWIGGRRQPELPADPALAKRNGLAI